MSFGSIKNVLLVSAAMLLLISQNGCVRQNASASSAPMTIPKTEVVVDTVAQNDVQLYMYVDGRLRPYKEVDIRVRVAGFLEQLFFRSGAIVKQGDPLAFIEQYQYEIALEAAKAELANAEAREALTKANLERGKQLVESRALSPEEFQERQAAYDMAVATVALSKSNVRKAELDLQYTDMKSPIPGKTTKNLVDIGNYVSPSGTQSVLLSVAQLDPIYVDFTLSDRQFADMKERMGFREDYEKALQEPGESPDSPARDDNTGNVEKAKQILPALNGNYDVVAKQGIDISTTTSQDVFSVDYPLHGHIIALIDNKITWETASITLRGEIRNPLLKLRDGNEDYLLYPGQVCRVRIPYENVKNAVLVHEEAILTDLDTKYVLVVKKEPFTAKDRFGRPMVDPVTGEVIPATEEHVVHRRDIRIGKLLDTQQRIVLEGLQAGETYIVKGVQRARIGAAVSPLELQEYLKQRSLAGGAAINPPATKTESKADTEETPIKASVIDDPEKEPSKPADAPKAEYGNAAQGCGGSTDFCLLTPVS